MYYDQNKIYLYRISNILLHMDKIYIRVPLSDEQNDTEFELRRVKNLKTIHIKKKNILNKFQLVSIN